MSRYDQIKVDLRAAPATWLITGVAGFIGSNLLEVLLSLEQKVIGLDNFSTGYPHNLEKVKHRVTEAHWKNFSFIEGDIARLEDCRKAVSGVDYVLHQAALGSVPASIADPIATNLANVDGFLNMLVAARDEGVKSFTYAASSATYGDHPGLPKVEGHIGNPLSPYAVAKYVNELYAGVFSRAYGFGSTGLRYFNIFGPRQDPDGAYAAVIPKWVSTMIRNEPVSIHGDGETSRDFCFVQDAVQANLLAAVLNNDELARVYNVACGVSTSLNQLFAMIREQLGHIGIDYAGSPKYSDFRHGDIRHSQADIRKIGQGLGYAPEFSVDKGLALAIPWYMSQLAE
ncbi:wbpP [Alcanivorax sp. S71-1-4]|uniref:NAD-dependent epimerase/dehydratase family protein n=1 Tax=Alcanivorax sp. S71-1-4 TaxID=1177159 RepID=UPI00135799CC|nr:NAD-dependent epimerase/dehydratase family protein [Alcanivorax sp. S71-1-4]KAF0809829.1 wbpP [Alcanivorax sp. S71-1-4]